LPILGYDAAIGNLSRFVTIKLTHYREEPHTCGYIWFSPTCRQMNAREAGKRQAGLGGRNGKTVSSRVAGRATEAGTKRFAARFADRFASDFHRASACDLTVSSLGMGTYLGECDDQEDERYTSTLAAGIDRGLNLIDTAINYRCQRSERAVGRALKRTIDSGSASRDEIVVCTKAGYVPLESQPPASRDEYSAYLEAEYFSRSIMSRADLVAGGHCLRPRFIADQIERSRANMNVDCIDIFYLHNPEQQLDSLDRSQFGSVMRDAFAELESQVADGAIGSYGCATWHGFRVFAANKTHLSLTELLGFAQEAGGKDHHFRSIQLPVNLAMTEAVRSPTQIARGKHFSILDLARDEGVSVIASASLMQAQLTHDLPPQVRSLFPAMETDAQRAISFVRSLPVASAIAGMRSVSHLDENIASGAAVIRA
jgi:aryl-alcohol dehydrogenase-like predicted oxidoreductase